MNQECFIVPKSVFSANLSPSEFYTFISLLALWQKELPEVVATQTEIAELCGLSKGTLSKVFKDLSHKNVLTRTVSTDKELRRYLKTNTTRGVFTRYKISDRYNPRKIAEDKLQNTSKAGQSNDK